jgi:pimeloyl-ACP methyl ester carboxylesterase
MRSDEVRAAGRLAGQLFGGVVSQVEHVHQAVAKRSFGPTGPLGRPARVVHDGIAQAVYGGLRGGGSIAGACTGQVMSMVAREDRETGPSSSMNVALSALNAAIGDRLADAGDPLAIPMAVREVGRDVVLTRGALAATHPRATPKLVVFVHGLGETEGSWRPGRGAVDQVSYGDALRDELGYTPVYLRYNTGRHISDNGRELAGLLRELTDAWPAPVEELLLIGHSMGGLVIRSACHDGQAAAEAWVGAVRHVFYLGSPHLGAPLARGAGLLGWLLARAPETRAFAPMVNGPSAGIRDLRFGYILEEDWIDCHAETCLRDHRHDAPLLDGADHYAISVTVTTDPSHLVGRLVGDLLVRPASAHGRRRRHQHVAFPVDGERQLGGMHHFDLLRHGDVWAEMRSLLDPSRRRSPDIPDLTPLS